MSETADEGRTWKPLDPARFEKMKAAFEKFGGEIDTSDEALYAMWESNPDALAETLDSKYIRMRPNPDTTTVFEEFIHTAQFRTGEYGRLVEEFDQALALVKVEIKAQEKLLRNATKWGIPQAEIRRIQERLKLFQSAEERLGKE